MAADWLIAAKSALVVSKFHCFYLAQNLLSTKKVAEVSLPKFHYICLAQNLLKTRFSTRSPTCFEQIYLDMSREIYQV